MTSILHGTISRLEKLVHGSYGVCVKVDLISVCFAEHVPLLGEKGCGNHIFPS